MLADIFAKGRHPIWEWIYECLMNILQSLWMFGWDSFEFFFKNIISKQKWSVVKVKWMLFFSLLLPVFVFPHDGNTWSLVFDLVIYGTADEWLDFAFSILAPAVSLSLQNIKLQCD